MKVISRERTLVPVSNKITSTKECFDDNISCFDLRFPIAGVKAESKISTYKASKK